MTELLGEARSAYTDRRWQTAFTRFQQAEAAAPLAPADLHRLAIAAFLLGRLEEYFAIRERAYRRELERGDLAGAALTAMWIGSQRMVSGQLGPGTGWLRRAARLAAEEGTDNVVLGYLDLVGTFEAEATGDPERAVDLAERALEWARRFGDRDLATLALQREGAVLLSTGRTAEGLAVLDEAMVDVVAGEVSPMVTGIVYCGVIEGCWTVYDLPRAHEWTAAMAVWCDAQPELANFTGDCKVHRADLKQLHGAWAEARAELTGVDGSDVDVEAAALAAYSRGNLDRLQGRFGDAEAAFAEAARLGLEPQPGLALLRLVRGSTQAAAAMIRRSLTESSPPARRVEVLCAAVEILLAVGDEDGAAAAAAELSALTEGRPSPVVGALAAQARATVDLLAGRAEAVPGPLREAIRTWLKVRAPYQEARARTMLARACRSLGDAETAERELGIARGLLERLGAHPDLALLGDGRQLLSPRETEVLRLVATGATNRAIATDLVLSERTVDRHVSNIFTKLGVSSRAAATARAIEWQLVPVPTPRPPRNG